MFNQIADNSLQARMLAQRLQLTAKEEVQSVLNNAKQQLKDKKQGKYDKQGRASKNYASIQVKCTEKKEDGDIHLSSTQTW